MNDNAATTAGRRGIPTVPHSRLLAPLGIVLFGIASAGLYYWARDLHRFIQWIAGYISLFIGQFAIYVLACYLVWKRPAGRTRLNDVVTISAIVIFAALFRAELIPQRPFLSTDVYRYVWDGRVQAAGINPYRYVPDAEQLEELRDGVIFPQINRGDYAPTPYPAMAELVFLAVYKVFPSSVTGFKAAMSLFDLLTILAIALVLRRQQLDPARVILFAWHPLLIFESAHSGHVDAVFIAFLALALLAWSYRSPAGTGFMIALAALVKFYPALVLPVFLFSGGGSALEGNPVTSRLKELRGLLLRRENLILLAAFGLTVVAVYVPYLVTGVWPFGSLANEFREEGFVESGGRYFLLEIFRLVAPFPTWVFIALATVVLVTVAYLLMMAPKREPADVARAAAALIGLYLIVSSPRYHWYYAWIIPFLCLAPAVEWLYLTGAAVLLYTLWYTPYLYPDLPGWLGASIYGPVLAGLVWHAWQRYSTQQRLVDSGP